MMTSNQAMLKGLNPSYGAEPPVLIDWLPWSHTFGGNNNFNLVLANGGSYYVDEGKPLPGAIEETVRNLREVSPTVYYNVPKGFEMLLPYVQSDKQLRQTLFAKLQAFVYAGAALPPHVREELSGWPRRSSVPASGDRKLGGVERLHQSRRRMKLRRTATSSRRG